MHRTLSQSSLSESELIPPDTSLPLTVAPEIALARNVAVEDPALLFEPRLGVRALQQLAPNTLRGYRSDWITFVECCDRHGRTPLPASPSAIEVFIEWRSPLQDELVENGSYKYLRASDERRPSSAAALNRALAAISCVHRALRCADPTADADVKAALQINIRGRRLQGQKDPLRWSELERALQLMGDDLWARRNRALAAVANSTLFRRSELVALSVEDYVRLPTNEGRMLVRKTKTEDPTYRKYRHLNATTVEYLDAWLTSANISEGPIFRGITPDQRIKIEALGAGEVARIFKSIAQLAGLDSARISGHSTRIGGAHDLKVFGADTLDIMHDGGWKSPQMPARYIEGLAADESSSAKLGRARRAEANRSDKEN